MQPYDLSNAQIALIILVIIWDITWKGLALWRAARNQHTGWFIAILIINSLGILPIIYLLLHKDHKSTR